MTHDFHLSLSKHNMQPECIALKRIGPDFCFFFLHASKAAKQGIEIR